MRTRFKTPSNWIVFLTFVMNALLTQLSIYLYLASMPAMKIAMHTNNSHIQLTYSYFMLGMGLAIIFSGYFIKKISYRQLLLINNLIFILATALIFLIDNISIFLILRVLQGVGCSLGSVFIIMVIIREQYEKKASIRVFSFLLSALALVPIVAPFIGGYVQDIYGWKGNFLILLVISFGLMIATFLFFPKIKNKSGAELQKSYISHLKEYLRDKHFFSQTVYSILIVNIIVSYNVASPFLLQNHLAISATFFGWLAAFIGFMFSLGAFCNSGLIKKYNINFVVKIGLIISSIGMALFLICSYLTPYSVSGIVVPFAIVTFGLAILYPNLTAYSYENIKENALVAASLFATLNIISNFITVYIVASIPEESPIFFAWVITLMQLLLLSYFYKKKPMDKQTGWG
ncbi:multidrug resistance protein D [Legionella drozanskii LLAP-1]|uniref:Multidrug resistance protein D n=1 Tax=Legionella drozanskii LLAP-1 TaxID=1212489 RepID=A0A0W0SMG3_9GAMM|nr:multidrug resistance protein D [Legionella drozanskii LLAP-1]